MLYMYTDYVLQVLSGAKKLINVTAGMLMSDH